ncbi:metal dependent phosphohydrolase [Thermincola ferriacetica]|uniref:bis(5'-nucleosyl)-tetraphosphatase (symmetrical) n=2 Tax=Thermincola TaxID=278993 RepID=D5XBC1_THEPJ|nr:MULTISPECIES: bis(5'-nucleosyl)-tetraphosphatase (symmetrical) YqeK [Thermincola]ADG83350.1 metal dependent phosphohydrolase [Thermincola potens JR]KNZ69532.1 metal dependent phosphohydrolase [Thermincola ferriacetica]
MIDGIDLEKLRRMMDDHRFRHTIGVLKTAEQMARCFHIDLDKARIAAVLHDCARNRSALELLDLSAGFKLSVDFLERQVPDLLHGKVGAEIARREFGVQDEEILNAIRRHTLGDENMTTLDKVIFVADMIEPGRQFPGVDRLRELAAKNLDAAVLAGLNSTLNYVIAKNGIIHPKSIEARNALILSGAGQKTP